MIQLIGLMRHKFDVWPNLDVLNLILSQPKLECGSSHENFDILLRLYDVLKREVWQQWFFISFALMHNLIVISIQS